MATYTSNYGWTKPSGSDNVDISVLNNNLDDQDSTIHDAFLNMAPPFSESSTYAVDDIVLYGTGLYKCHTAVVTPGSWTGSTNWQVYKLSEGGGGGTSDYSALNNKPQINGVTLTGNKTTQDLNISYDDLQNKPSIPSAQVQSDWNQTDSSKADFIKNKPSIPDELSDLTDDSSHRTVTDTEKATWNGKSDFSGDYNDLQNKPTIPDAQVQADWDQTDTDAVDYIKNKPNIPAAQIQSDWNQNDDTKADYIKNKPALGTAAAKSVPTRGDAGSGEVVMGNDSRLSDSRPASDVSSWAKQAVKPTYTASEVGAIPSTDKGANGGVAELDSNGKVPSSQLPSYVDDVLSYSSQSAFPATGETGKIYIAEDTNKTYRWSGSAYAEISASLALGETSSTAYRGDRGKTAYDHSQTTGNPHGTTKSDVGLGNVPNVTTNDQKPTFTKASTRNNIASGEKLSVIFGKIQKFFNDLKTVAFSGSYTDLSNKPQINGNTLSGNKTTSDLGINADNVMLSDGVTSVEDKIGNMRMTKLWENPNPSINFDAQTIQLSSSNYDLLLVIARYATTLGDNVSNISSGASGYITFGLAGSDGPTNYSRIYGVNGNQVTFGNCEMSVHNSPSKVTANNTLIPYQIYGIKLT